ncbi:MAG: hypothetical protein J7497_04515 [Chitinophagaceae bacterium]|nr:hypothetical protein [Chitinophagaceae bacterium]
MQYAIDRFQKQLFVFLLYSSAFFGIVTDLAKINSKTPFYAAFDLIIILLALTSFSYLKGTLAYITIFIIAGIGFNMSYSGASTFATLNGAREIIVIPALVVFLKKIFSEDEETIGEYLMIMKKFGFIFLLAQLPVAAYQFSVSGPSDAVGGTFGNMGSGVLTLSVICLVYYLHFFSRNFTQTIFLYIALTPLLLNETKISFILIPMMVLSIHFKPKFKNIVLAVVAAGLFLFIFDSYYSHGSLEFDDNVSGIFSADFLNDYLMADIYEYEDIPRFTKIILSWNLLSQQVNTFFFGMEYGLFKGDNFSDLSTFARNYYWLLIGTRPYLFFLLMQGGICLFGGIMWLLLYINNYFKNINNLKIFLFILFLLILMYNDTFRNHTFMIIYLFIVFFANSKWCSEGVEIREVS